MENNFEFFRLAKYGALYMDKIIFEAAYPVLFICTDEKKHLFMCVCCQNNEEGRRWLICRTTADNILDMLRDKASIRASLLKMPNDRFMIYEAVGEKPTEVDDSTVWEEESIYLPKKGEFLDAEPGEFDDEIQYYEDLNWESYNKKFECGSQDYICFVPSLGGEVIINVAAITAEEMMIQKQGYLEEYRELVSQFIVEWDSNSAKMEYDVELTDSDLLDAA